MNRTLVFLSIGLAVLFSEALPFASEQSTVPVKWRAAQGLACKFDEAFAQCRAETWGFEIRILPMDEIKAIVQIEKVQKKILAVRPDQDLVVFFTRWFNRGDLPIFLEPISLLFWVRKDTSYAPISLTEILAAMGGETFLNTDDGKWFQQHVLFQTLYVPPHSYTERYILYRVPAFGCCRIHLEANPIWIGTEALGFSLWAEPTQKQPGFRSPAQRLKKKEVEQDQSDGHF